MLLPIYPPKKGRLASLSTHLGQFINQFGQHIAIAHRHLCPIKNE
ncbi:MAG: hypothetical protein R2825_06470 [Saprospiraceae bacterium]|jgi:hypothetical protein